MVNINVQKPKTTKFFRDIEWGEPLPERRNEMMVDAMKLISMDKDQKVQEDEMDQQQFEENMKFTHKHVENPHIQGDKK